jgi:cell division protein FtsQ
MAQLPASMRRRQPATTSIHEQAPQLKDLLLQWGSWLLLFLACLVLIFGAYMLYQRMIQAKIAKVEVLNVSPSEQQTLTHFLHDQIQGSFFTTDLEQIRDRALSLSWVDRVVVSRQWPDSIVLRVIPRHAVARWGTGRLLSDDGVVFQPVDPVPVAQLPLLHGPQSQANVMMNKYRDINQMFAPMHIQLKELYLTERMTWFMQFDSGLRVIVDQDQTMSKLQRLSRLASTDLKVTWQQIAAIDLRYRNGFAIQWKDAQAPKIVDGHFVLEPHPAAVAAIASGSP